MQTEFSAWERIINNWGWPTLVVFALAYVIRVTVKALWPLAQKYIETIRDAAEKSQAALREQLNVANLRAEKESREIADALREVVDKADEMYRAQTEALVEVKQALVRVADTQVKVIEKLDTLKASKN